MINVLLVGPHPKLNGGISTVLKNYRSFKDNRLCSFLLHPVTGGGSMLYKLFYIFPSLIGFFLKLSSKKIDVVHMHPSEYAGFFRYIPFVYVAKLLKKPVILHIHGCKFDSFYNNSNILVKKIISSTLNKSDAIIALSQSWAEIFRKISTTKIYVVNNSVQEPGTNPYDINTSSITFMGFIGPRKGVFDLLKSIKDIIKSYNFKLEICGSGEEVKLLKVIREYAIQDRATFHGWIGLDEKDKILRKTQIFILPSYNEGLPMVLLEAMSYGIPVISTTVGGIPELVEKENGFLIEPGDISALKEKIICLLEDQELRQQMSINNYKKIKENFTMDYTFNMLKIIYSEILN